MTHEVFGKCHRNVLYGRDTLGDGFRIVYGTVRFNGIPQFVAKPMDRAYLESRGQTVEGHFWLENADGEIGDVIFPFQAAAYGRCGVRVAASNVGRWIVMPPSAWRGAARLTYHAAPAAVQRTWLKLYEGSIVGGVAVFRRLGKSLHTVFDGDVVMNVMVCE